MNRATPFRAVRELRAELMTETYEALCKSFSDLPDTVPGEIIEGLGTTTYIGEGMSAIVEEDDVFGVTANNRQFLIEPIEASYTLTDEHRWPTSEVLDGISESLPMFKNLGMDSMCVQELEQQVESLRIELNDMPVTKDILVDAICEGDIDLVESITDPTLPSTRADLRVSLDEFGDSSPPIVRAFIANTSERDCVYNDSEIALIRSCGKPDGEHRWSIAVGVDDGGPFIHPMPPALRIDNSEYQLTRQDIRDILGYDAEWSKTDTTENDTWYRMQGDLLMKYMSLSDVDEARRRINLEDQLDSIDTSEFLDEQGLSDLEEFIDFSIDTRFGFNMELNFTSGEARSDVSLEGLAKMVGSTPQEVRDELKSSFLNWARRECFEVDVEEVEMDETSDIPIPVDNHLVLVPNSIESPYDGRLERRLIPRETDRDFAYVVSPDPVKISIQHKEHDPLIVEGSAGMYIFTLSRRR